MSIPFGTTLRHFNEVIAAALPGFLAPATNARHELLWDCYLSGQITDADLEREIAGDAALGTFVATSQQRH